MREYSPNIGFRGLDLGLAGNKGIYSPDIGFRGLGLGLVGNDGM